MLRTPQCILRSGDTMQLALPGKSGPYTLPWQVLWSVGTREELLAICGK